MKFVFSHRFVVVLCFPLLFSPSQQKASEPFYSVFHRRSTKQIKIQSREEIWYWLKFYFSIFILRWNFRSLSLRSLDLLWGQNGEIENSLEWNLENTYRNCRLGFPIILLFIEKLFLRFECALNLKVFFARENCASNDEYLMSVVVHFQWHCWR